ncbi:Uncharacterized protein YjbI, contains pentapeptide repeats [Lachnospiraceae bacterium XBB1006]|nr:Uncharacterized protein YjbI, contains pentapeptide repeats [Lachnospiraceae bacterium XBB1006]
MQISMGMTVLSQKKIERAEFDHRMEEHAKWLKNHEKGKRADFSDVDLSEMNLSGMDFSYAEMKGVNLGGANLTRANLSHANLWGAYLHNIDLTEAMLDETVFINANLTLSKLNGCKGEKTRFTFVCMWDCEITNASLKKADFFEAQICNCDFTGSDLEEACFACADFDPEYLKGVKGLRMHMFCPEEGSFIAWKKCRDGKIVKLLIPEHAERKGNTVYNCRASEAVVLEIYDKDGISVDEAVSRYNKEFKYAKGAKVIAEELDPRRFSDVSGIYFVLSRADAEALPDREEAERDEENE